jgi:hypothetical protein
MKNWLVLLLLLILPWMKGVGQCPAGSVVLKTQVQVDSFSIKYPNCTEIDDSLIITGTMSTLESLNNLTKISSLIINNTSDLKNLEGLNNLKIIYRLEISNNQQLGEINQFDKLVEINNLSIFNNPNLMRVRGFDSVEESNSISISNNSNLKEVAVFARLNKLSKLFIYRNEVFSSMSGFNKLEYISDIDIEFCDSLSNIDTFYNLKYAWQVVIYNSGILNLNFLSNIEKIERLRIDNNNQLLEIHSIGNNITINSVSIGGNFNLREISGLKALNINNLSINSNPSLIKIGSLEGIYKLKKLYINSNENLQFITSNRPYLGKMESLSISNNGSLMNIDSFVFCDSIGNLNISNNPKLESIKFIDFIKTIGSYLSVEKNPELLEIDLSSLNQSEKLSIKITANKKLSFILLPINSYLNTFTFYVISNPCLKAIRNGRISTNFLLNISDNTLLSSIDFLDGLTEIGNSCIISSNNSLLHLEPLKNLKRAQSITISNNELLNNLYALDSLTKVSSLIISDNRNLNNLFSSNCTRKVITNSLTIKSNPSLKQIVSLKDFEVYQLIDIEDNDGLEKIDLSKVSNGDSLNVNIKNNSNLSIISLLNIKELKSFQIQGNTKLVTIGRFDSLLTIENLNIESNDQLTDLLGLSSVVNISNIKIWDNNNLESLDDLKSLNSIQNNIDISYNKKLKRVLPQFLSSNNTISITNNPELTDIFGLTLYQSINNIVLINNPKLSDCAIQSICKSLESNLPVYIYGNGMNCNSKEEVKLQCNSQNETVYPNPTHNQLNFTSFPLDQNASIKIYDIYGRQVFYTLTIQPELDISALANGTYILEVKSDKINYTKKFVKY